MQTTTTIAIGIGIGLSTLEEGGGVSPLTNYLFQDTIDFQFQDTISFEFN